MSDIAAQNKIRYYTNNGLKILYHKGCYCNYLTTQRIANSEPINREDWIRRSCKHKAYRSIKLYITENVIEAKNCFNLSYLEHKCVQEVNKQLVHSSQEPQCVFIKNFRDKLSK